MNSYETPKQILSNRLKELENRILELKGSSNYHNEQIIQIKKYIETLEKTIKEYNKAIKKLEQK